MDKQAEELNSIISEDNPAVYDLLSKRGKEIFFPKKGILAQAKEAKGKKINSTIGVAMEEDGTPMRLNSIADNIPFDPEHIFLYAPSYGKPELRMIWKDMIEIKNPDLSARTSTPVVTNAITHGLSIIGYLFVDPKDRIILTDKFWGNYRLIFQNSYEADLSTFNTFSKWKFDLKSFEDALKEAKGKKIVLLNFPNNPTGYSPTEEEADEIAAIIKKRAESGDRIVVICDDAYFGLVYEKGTYRQSVFAKLAKIHENVLAVKLDGATKEDYVWGFRTGFITYSYKDASEEALLALEHKTAGAVRGTISNAAHISQTLVMNAFNSVDYLNEKMEKYMILKSRYEEVKKALKKKRYKEFFEALPFNSGYFMCIRMKGVDAEQVRKILLDDYSTGVIAMGDILRIAYSSVPKESITQLFENIYSACQDAVSQVTK